MTLRNKIAYYFDYVRPTWTKKRLVETALQNKDPWDEDLSKRFWKQQRKFDNKQRKEQQRKSHKIKNLLKKGKRKQAAELLLDKKLS